MSLDPKTAKDKAKSARREELEKLCAEQIIVPPQLPGILKQYTKGAIRTQPANLLVWSIAYFRCMQHGLVPPVKDKIETGPAAAAGKLTVGFLKVLHKQLGDKKSVTFQELLEKWKAICQDEKQLNFLYLNNKIDKRRPIEWKRVLPLLTTLIGKNMNENMTMVCQVFSTRKDFMMNWDEFWDIYTGLVHTLRADVHVAMSHGSIPVPVTDNVKHYLHPLAEANKNLIGPQDFNDPQCPPM